MSQPVDPQLTKVTVYLTPLAVASLNAASQHLRDTKTDTINRALIWYRNDTREGRYWLRWTAAFSFTYSAHWSTMSEFLPGLHPHVKPVIAMVAGVAFARWMVRRPSKNYSSKPIPVVETR